MLQREFTQAVNQQFAENAAVSMLVERESKKQYSRKMLSQPLSTPEYGKPPPQKA